jgi:hypothetical protein
VGRSDWDTVVVPVDLEAELDDLYGADLADFVPARNRLAALLRSEGRRAEAERVRELRKPSLSAWTINQLARKRRRDVDLLLDAGHRLGVAQRALVGGGADREAFDAARKAEREALKRLVQAATSILAERPSTATLERVSSTLRAAAVSDEARPDLARGRLTSDVDLSGFEAFAGLPTGSPKRRAPAAPARQLAPRREDPDDASRRQAAKRDAISRARAGLNAAREKEAGLAKQLREATRAEREALAALERLQRSAERLRVDHEAAARALEAARAKLDEARGS